LDITNVGGQHDNSRVRKFRENRNHRIQTVHLGHLQIHERDVRTVRSMLVDGFAPVRSFGNQADVRLAREDCRDASPEKRVIVYCEDSNWTDHESILRIFVASVGEPESESFAYASEAGTVNSSSVPDPSSLQKTSLPPANLARSHIPVIP